MAEMSRINSRFSANNERIPLLMDSSCQTRYQDDDDDDTTSTRSQRDEQVGHSYENHLSYNCSIMTLFFIGGCGVPLAVLPIMVSCKDHPEAYVNHIYNFSMTVRSTYVGVATILLMFALFRMRTWIADGHISFISETIPPCSSTSNDDINPKQESTENELPISENPVVNHVIESRAHSNPFPYAVIGFGVGGALYLILQSAKTLYLQYTITPKTHFSTFDRFSTAVNILYVAATSILIIFLAKFKHVTLLNCAFYHFFIAVLIGLEIWIWLSLTISPIYLLTNDCDSNLSTSNNNTDSSVDNDHVIHHDLVYATLENVGNFLKPFLVEFSTISIGILLNLWERMEGTHYDEQQFSNNPNLNFDHPNGGIDTISNVGGRKKLVADGLVIAGSLLISVAYVLVYITLSGHFPLFNNHTNYSVYAWDCIHVLLHFPMLAFFIPIWKKMKRNKIRLSLSSLTCSELFLIATSTVNYVYFLFRLLGCLSLLSFAHQPDTEQLVFLSCFACLACLNNWLQTYYLLGIGCLQRSGVVLSNYDKYGLVYIGTFHIAAWALTCLGHEFASDNPAHLLPELTTAFSDFSTRILILIIYPLLEFYFFHSAIICFEVAKKI